MSRLQLKGKIRILALAVVTLDKLPKLSRTHRGTQFRWTRARS